MTRCASNNPDIEESYETSRVYPAVTRLFGIDRLACNAGEAGGIAGPDAVELVCEPANRPKRHGRYCHIHPLGRTVDHLEITDQVPEGVLQLGSS